MIRPALMLPLFVAFFFASSVSAQESDKNVPFSDENWGENQDIHKAFEYWLDWEKAGPDTNVSVARKNAFREFSALPRPKEFFTIQSATPAWRQVGGAQGGNVSGRPTCLAFSKQHTTHVYLAVSCGGLWKSTNTGDDWTYISSSFATSSMGAVAVDYTDDNIVYAGTGDLYDGNTNESGSSEGLYKSTDAGLNWENIASASEIGNAVNQIVLHPQNHEILYLAANDGVRKSLDAGNTWKKVLSLGGTTTIVVDPNNGENIWAAGAGSIRRSTDGGTTWPGGDVASEISGKSTITLALALKDNIVLYAGVGAGNAAQGIAKSVDSGATWVLKNALNYAGNQAWYDNACTVRPNDPQKVLVGGLDLYGSNNGGTSFTQRADWTNSPGRSDFVHADIHVLQYSPYGTAFVWCLSDGGVFRSADNGSNWVSCNRTLPTILFVGGDADKDFTYAVGGAQDNGVNKASTDSNVKIFKTTHGGDGGRTFVSQTGDGTVYSTYVYGYLLKSLDNGESWNIGPSGYNILPEGSGVLNELREGSGPFYMYYDVSESDPANVVIAGTKNVYYSNNGVNSLDPITKSNAIPGLTTVHIPGANGNTVYAGTSTYVYFNSDVSAGTASVWAKSATNVGRVSDYATAPHDESKVWVSISGYGSHHFGYSEDFGQHWVFPATNMPNVNCLTIARAENGDLFLGHSLGVMRSIDNGVTWEPLRDGIPLAQITKLRVRGPQGQKSLLATTYGHGMYGLNITDLPRTIAPFPTNSVALHSVNDKLRIESLFPNPAAVGGELTINYFTATTGPLTVKIFDDLGKEIKTAINEYTIAGNHRTAVKLPESGGNFWLALTSGGQTVTDRIVAVTN